MAKCPICGAPVDGNYCEYCGFHVAGYRQTQQQNTRQQNTRQQNARQQGPYQYADQAREEQSAQQNAWREHYQQTARQQSYQQNPYQGYGQNPYQGYQQNAYQGYGQAPPRYADYGDRDAYGRPLSTRNRWVAFVLCFFLGVLGIHRFYAGKIGTGLIWLFTGGLFGIGWLVDMIMIATGSFNDNHGMPLRG